MAPAGQRDCSFTDFYWLMRKVLADGLKNLFDVHKIGNPHAVGSDLAGIQRH
jgi:hypothetical protein